MLSNVLVATDGSDNAQRAVELGSSIGASFGARVIVVYVQVEKRERGRMGALWDQVGPQPVDA
jgi:nucleotide-binding universal stress UspA family protein